MSAAPVLYTCDDHASVYHHLAAGAARGLALSHLDAHCDLKGTLIDVEAGRVWLRRKNLPVSGSTYLSHLVAEGIAAEVEWIHDEVGGRRNDLGTVLYATDLRSLSYRFVRRPDGRGVAVSYHERWFDEWTFHQTGGVLDIDWDFFADWRKSRARAEREIDEFLARKLEAIPERVYVAYSSHYSRPGQDAYREFVERLARRLSARIEPIPEAPAVRAGALARALPAPVRRLLRNGAVALKRIVVR